MTFTLDSNILVYALDLREPDKRTIASDILIRALKLDLVLSAQAVAEFLAVVRRKNPSVFRQAWTEAELWASVVPIVPTTWAHISEAAAFAERHRLQLWDCIIWQVARSAGASVLLSEDLQDGLSIDGMTVVNPFDSKNSGAIERLLGK